MALLTHTAHDQTDLRENFLGGVAQVVQFISVAVLNIALPRFLGAYEFGIAASMLALPYACYGLCERSVSNAVMPSLATPHRAWKRVATVLRDTTGVFWMAGLITMVGAHYLMRVVAPEASSNIAITAGLVFFPMAFNLVLFAVVYSLARSSVAVRAYLVHGVSLNLGCVGFSVVLGLRAWGLILGVLCAQILVALYFLIAQRDVFLALFRELRVRATPDKQLILPYLAGLPAQLPSVIVSWIVVLILASLISLEAAGQYRIATSLVMAGAMITPISPAVVQATVARRWFRQEDQWGLGSYLKGLGIIAAISTVAGLIVVYAFGGRLIRTVYGTGFDLILPCLQFLILGLLPWVTIRSGTAVFLGAGKYKTVTVLNIGIGTTITILALIGTLTSASVVTVAKLVTAGLGAGGLLYAIALRRLSAYVPQALAGSGDR